MMKVLLINGSPHRAGCTYTALREVEKTLHKRGVETEIFWIGVQPVQGCIACRKCFSLGKCVFDDAVNTIAEKADEIDGLVVGSPVYYAGASGQITALMDRLMFSASHRFAKKPAAAVVSCRRGGASAAYDQLNKYFGMNNMPIVPSQYWNQIHGNTAEEARKDLEGLQTMRTLGENMAWLLKCIETGRNAGIDEPYYEERQSTNFIR